MRVLLVQPAYEASFWTYSEAQDITGTPGYMPNIALPTLAALAPDGVEITIVDEAVEPIDFSQKWDLVGITGYVTQKKRMITVADEFRRRGQLVAIGGPYATLSASTLRPHADIMFIGEAELTWPEFLNDFKNGGWKKEYRADGMVDIQTSPIPDISDLNHHAYFTGVVQTSRGCPYQCEFCDVIVYLGRKQRHKTPEHVVAEIENLYQKGFRSAFLADDNLTANRKRCFEIMAAIAEWNKGEPKKMTFATQMSIDVARESDTELLKLCSHAGLKQAFVGIETPNQAALREVKKRQNLRSNLVADVWKIQSHGIMVVAGTICGFDSDTTDSFRALYDFAQMAGVPIVQFSILNAPEGTPLEKRLLKENRLRTEAVDDVIFETNIIPKEMTSEQLMAGAIWLKNKLYTPSAFLERLSVFADNLPETRVAIAASRRGTEIWKGILDAYERLGPEFQDLPREAVKLFRKKSFDHFGAAMIFCKHAVCMLRKRGIWNPEIARLDEPDFGSIKKPVEVMECL